MKDCNSASRCSSNRNTPRAVATGNSANSRSRPKMPRCLIARETERFITSCGYVTAIRPSLIRPPRRTICPHPNPAIRPPGSAANSARRFFSLVPAIAFSSAAPSPPMPSASINSRGGLAASGRRCCCWVLPWAHGSSLVRCAPFVTSVPRPGKLPPATSPSASALRTLTANSASSRAY